MLKTDEHPNIWKYDQIPWRTNRLEQSLYGRPIQFSDVAVASQVMDGFEPMKPDLAAATVAWFAMTLTIMKNHRHEKNICGGAVAGFRRMWLVSWLKDVQIFRKLRESWVCA